MAEGSSVIGFATKCEALQEHNVCTRRLPFRIPSQRLVLSKVQFLPLRLDTSDAPDRAGRETPERLELKTLD